MLKEGEKAIRNAPSRQHIYMEPAARDKLKTLSRRSGLSMSEVVRRLIEDVSIRETPPADYRAMIAELRAIGNNLNQIAYVANASGHPQQELFLREAAHLRNEILRIRQAVEMG